MANRILATLTETPGDYSPPGWRHSVEVQRSAAGQPGLLITTSRQLDDGPEEEITVVVEDGLDFLAPVLKWLLTPEVVAAVKREHATYIDQSVHGVLDTLVRVAEKRAG